MRHEDDGVMEKIWQKLTTCLLYGLAVIILVLVASNIGGCASTPEPCKKEGRTPYSKTLLAKGSNQ